MPYVFVIIIVQCYNGLSLKCDVIDTTIYVIYIRKIY